MNKLTEKIISILKTKEGKIDFAAIVTLICLILSTLGVDPSSIQSWRNLIQVVFSVLTNPYKIALIVGAVYGWYRNNQAK